MFFFLVISCKKDKELVWCCSVISVERPVTDAITRSLVPQSVSFKKEVHRKKVGHSGSPVGFVVVQFVHHKRGKSKCRATEMNKQSRIKEGIYFDKEISRCGRENHHFQFREKGSTYFQFILYWKKNLNIYFEIQQNNHLAAFLRPSHAACTWPPHLSGLVSLVFWLRNKRYTSIMISLNGCFRSLGEHLIIIMR